jgi:hypothetical protein
MSTKTPYAVVPTPGCYNAGSRVRPLSRHRTLEAADRAARRATREYRAGMARFGGSSGGYRVVEATCDAWLGHDLDRTPTATSGS